MAGRERVLRVTAATLSTGGSIRAARVVVEPDVTFEAFYRAEGDDLFRALSVALGDVDLAREATDEGFVRAYQHWRKVSRYDNPAGWVYRVALNWARSRLRKTKREVVTHQVHERSVGWSGDPTLIQAIGELPIEFRSVVVLRYLLQWSTAEVAEAMDLPTGTVKSRLSRALNQLRSALESE